MTDKVLTHEDSIADLEGTPRPDNPNVKPAAAWKWTGTIAAFLVAAEVLADSLRLIPDLPKWVYAATAAIPSIGRFIRTIITGLPVSFRRANP
jgi:hypothetical protein